jgi:hypothetical protein
MNPSRGSEKKSSKGQSETISHSITILFSLTLILAVVASMNKIEADYQNFTSDLQSKEICALIKASAEKIYKPVGRNITINRTEEMGYSVLSLPQKLGNYYYHLRLYNNTVELETPESIFTCEIGINATLNGTSSGGKTRLRWLLGNGTNSIAMENG